MDKEKREKRGLALVILALVVFHAAHNYLWQALNPVPAFNDEAHHLTDCWRFINFFQLGELKPLSMYLYYGAYPPFFYFFASLFYLLFGPASFDLLLPNLFFFAVLLGSVAAIAFKAGGRRAALWSCLLVSVYPYVYASSRIFTLEMPLMSLVALAIAFLYHSEGFRKPAPAAGFIAACCLGAVTKQSFVIYIAGPLAVALWQGFHRPRTASQEKGNLFLFFIGASALALLAFYMQRWGRNYFFLFDVNFRDAAMFSTVTGETAAWQKWLFYFRILPEQLAWPALIAFFVGAFLYFTRVKGDRVFMAACLLAPHAFLMFAPLKDSSYSLAVLPVMAVITIVGLLEITNPRIRDTFLIAPLAFGLLLQYMLMFRVDFFFWVSARARDIKRSATFAAPYHIRPLREYSHTPRKNKWGALQTEMIRCMKEHAEPGDAPHVVGITDYSVGTLKTSPWIDMKADVLFTENYQILNEWGLRYLIARRHLPFRIVILSEYWKMVDWQDPPYAFLLTSKELSSWLPAAAPHYRLIEEIVFQDKSRIFVYKKA